MQNEDHASYHPGSYARRRFGRNRGRIVATAVLFVGLVIGVLSGRWSVTDLEKFVEEDPPTAPKDPHMTVLDEFEGMCVCFSSFAFPNGFIQLLFWF
jgi:hypothetical protein